jgi:hypothetical protein
LRSIFKRNVHLILQVRVAKRRSAWTECECISHCIDCITILCFFSLSTTFLEMLQNS